MADCRTKLSDFRCNDSIGWGSELLEVGIGFYFFDLNKILFILDKKSLWRHQVRSGITDEKDEGESPWAQDYQSLHHGRLPLRSGETWVPGPPAAWAALMPSTQKVEGVSTTF